MNRSAPLLIALVLTLSLALAAPAHAAWTWPLRGEVITTYRNGDDPYAAGQHRGIDVAGPVGAPVVAAVAGEVRFAGVAGSSGLTVSVRTTDGRFDTSYLHLSTSAVKAGEQVAAGQRLGAVGTSGHRSAEAPHLHFGVRNAGSQVYHDPLGLLPPLATAPETRPQAPAPVLATPAPSAAPVAAPAPRSVPVGAPRRAPRRVRNGAARRVPSAAPRRTPSAAPHRAPAPTPRRVSARAPEHSTPTGERLSGVEPQSVPEGVQRGVPEASREVSVSEPRRRRTGAPRSTSALLTRQHHARAGAPPGGRSHRRGTPSEHGPGSTHQASGERLRAAAGGPAREGGSASGPDVGWVLACLGLLAAAALVGTSGGGRSTARRGRATLRQLLGPLAGRG